MSQNLLLKYLYVSRLELTLHKKFLNHRNASIYVLTIFLNISKIYWLNLTLSVNIRIQLDFHLRAKLNIFSWKVVIIILYGNFLLVSADNARPLTIAPSHYHFSSSSRPSTLVLWHYCLFKFCLLFLFCNFLIVLHQWR